MSDYKKHLNPLFNGIEDIQNFSNVTKETELLKEEYAYLEPVVQKLVEEVQKDYRGVEKLSEALEKQIYEIETTTGDDHSDAVSLYNQLLNEMELKVNAINLKLEKLNSPYFGKIKFERKPENREIISYIGKFAIFDSQTKKILVTDWRAPIANLYYQNAGPEQEVSFESPAGKQEGSLTQKRQFEIARGRINNIYDAKTGNVAADEFLLSQLKGRVGKKLTDIVATIQSQQNEIIREDINKTVIIQGVAGSGKTTILLHKIAYILFKHETQITPNKSLIIAPNKMFLDYISDVLPSLGIDSLEHNTFLFWAKKILKWDDKYIISTTSEDLELKEYKGSYNFKLLLEEYFESFEEHLLENIPSTMKKDITEKYYSLKKAHPEISMKERIDLSINYASSQKQFRKNLSQGYVAPVWGADKKVKEIQDYVKQKYNPYKIYKNMHKYVRGSKYISSKLLLKLKKYNKEVLTENYYKTEDLAPILWMHFQIYGISNYKKDYVLADEAQDLSPFQILILREIAKNNNLTIAGDLAQSIVPPFYIKNWEEIISILQKEGQRKEEISYHKLHRCYRTTVEIIEFANKIFKKHFPKEFVLPKAVLRHGEPVEYIKDDGLIEKINEEFDKDIASLALICKDIHHANSVYKKLIKKKDKIKRQILAHDENNYESGLLVIPVEKAKGLEFDTVIVAEMTDEHYKANEMDIRLFYVAVTRALHKLYIHTLKAKKSSMLLSQS